jgi:hypothetical protein
MFRNSGAEDDVHEGLERSRRIAEAEVHHRWFKQSMSRFECGFMFVPFFDTYVVVPLAYVKFGEYDSSAKVANEIADEWEGVLIMNRPTIDLSVVLYWSQLPVLFLNEEEG